MYAIYTWKRKSQHSTYSVSGASRGGKPHLKMQTNHLTILVKFFQNFAVFSFDTKASKILHEKKKKTQFHLCSGVKMIASKMSCWGIPLILKPRKSFDERYPEFRSDPHNVGLGQANDGFNLFVTMSVDRSAWPVVLMVYNLLPQNLVVLLWLLFQYYTCEVFCAISWIECHSESCHVTWMKFIFLISWHVVIFHYCHWWISNWQVKIIICLSPRWRLLRQWLKTHPCR